MRDSLGGRLVHSDIARRLWRTQDSQLRLIERNAGHSLLPEEGGVCPAVASIM